MYSPEAGRAFPLKEGQVQSCTIIPEKLIEKARFDAIFQASSSNGIDNDRKIIGSQVKENV